MNNFNNFFKVNRLPWFFVKKTFNFVFYEVHNIITTVSNSKNNSNV